MDVIGSSRATRMRRDGLPFRDYCRPANTNPARIKRRELRAEIKASAGLRPWWGALRPRRGEHRVRTWRYGNLPAPLGVARRDMCNRISFVPTGQAARPVPDLSSVRQDTGTFDVQVRICLAVRRCRRRRSAVRRSRRSTGCPSIRCLER
jgi:hypothetical protein